MIASWLVVIEYKLHTARTCRVAKRYRTSKPSGIAQPRQGRCNGAMGSRSREVIYGGRIIGARIRAEGAQQAAQKAVREADRAAAELWSIQMEAHGGPAQPSPTIAQCLNGGYGWLQVKCYRCETEASIPLEHVR